jgi:light-regulated signal transduction histidine kinase (bacteriophytochrome)
MSTLICDLLDYSRVSAEDEAPPKPVDCNSLVAVALMNLRARFSKRGTNVTTEKLPVVRADEQFLPCFRTRSKRFEYRGSRSRDPSPRLRATPMRDRRPGQRIGIDMKNADHIFGLFQRLPERSEATAPVSGSQSAERLIERFGGRIWVESAWARAPRSISLS